MEDHTIRQIRVLGRCLRRQAERSPAIRQLESLTGMHCFIIGYLADHEAEDIYQRDLEHEFGLSRAAVSRQLTVMEDNGLIERSKVLSDDRLKKITLTPLAHRFTEEIRAENRRLERRLTAGFSQEELAALQTYLLRMQKNLAEQSGKENI